MCVRSVYSRALSIAVAARRASSSASWTSAASNSRLGAGVGERQRAERPAVRAQRRDDDRPQAQAPHECELLGIREAGDEHLVGQLAHELGPPGARDAHRPGGGGRIDREAAIELLAQLALDGVDVRGGDLAAAAPSSSRTLTPHQSAMSGTAMSATARSVGS